MYTMMDKVKYNIFNKDIWLFATVTPNLCLLFALFFDIFQLLSIKIINMTKC